MRSGGRPTIEATQSYRFPAKHLQQIVPPPGDPRPGHMDFGGGFVVNFRCQQYRGRPNETDYDGTAWLELKHPIRRDDRAEITYTVFLTYTLPPFGGRRWWFLCPETNRRVGTLYLPNGGRHFLSRHAYGLHYGCERETDADRMARKARKLHRAIGGDGQAIGQGCEPEKPKWMRWRTYARRLEEWRAADQRANELWMAGTVRFLERLGVEL